MNSKLNGGAAFDALHAKGELMATTLRELAALTGGQVSGDDTLDLTGAATLEHAAAQEITLLDTADKAPRLARSLAAAVLVPVGLTVDSHGLPQLQAADVHAAFAAIVRHFHPQRVSSHFGVHTAALVSPTARIAAGVTVHAGAFIGDEVEIGAWSEIHSGARILAGCRIAENVTIFPNVVLYEETVVGPRCIIHAGASLGAYGFGYKPVSGRHSLSAQLGNVILEADVEVGANAAIDRGTYGPTVIGEGTKIDNLVMIAHNCRLGKHNLICSQVGIAGSTTTGDYVVMAGQVGVRDHVHIGTGAVLGAMAGVANDVPEHTRMLGAPAIPEREQKLQFALLSKLPEMRKDVKAMKRQLAALTGAGIGETANVPEQKSEHRAA